MLVTSNYPSGQAACYLTLVLALASAPAWAASIGPGGEEVSVYVNVEKNGSLITGLGARNFKVYQDGKPQAFRLETPEQPASIALLVEYSSSSGFFIEDISEAVRGFLQHAIEGHWYGLAAYSQGLEVRQDFTDRIGEIRAAFSELGPPTWSEIDTYDAVYEMLDKMGRLPGRRVLVVIGSGIDTFSQRNLDQVKKKAEAENVTIFAAGLGSLFRGSYDPYLNDSARMSFAMSQAFLQMLAAKSGGFAWFPNQPSAFPDVMEGIMQSIQTQYRIVYPAPDRGSGKFRKLKVEAFRIVNDKREDFKVLVREGWR